MEAQILQIVKAIRNKKNNPGGITIPNFKLYYRAKATKTAWHWYKNRHEDQGNRIEDQGMNPCSYTRLIFDNVQWRNDTLLYKSYWENWISTCKRIKLYPCLSHCTNIN
jgi:hypothetical protein